MPLRTEHYAIDATIEDLRDEQEDIAEQVADADPESRATQSLQNQGQQLDRYIAGLEWFREEFESGEIALGALTNGERHRVSDTAQDGTYASRQNAFIAMGTQSAPYLEHDPENIAQQDFEKTVAVVADLHPGFADWAEKEITSLGRLDSGTGNSFRELVREKRNRED